MVDSCPVCNGSALLAAGFLDDPCPLCVLPAEALGDVLDQHEAQLLLPSILRRRAGLDWETAKTIISLEFDLTYECDNDKGIFSVTYKHTSDTWRGTPEQQLMSAQCRGAVFTLPQENLSDAYTCICLPFIKFWNHGEKHATTVAEPWSEDVFVQEKLDGHLMKLFHHQGVWHLVGNSSLDTDRAEDDLGGRSKKKLFEDALHKTTGLKLLELLAALDAKGTQYCHIFEVLHPHNVVIVPVKLPCLAHIGTRNMYTLHEELVDIGVPRPREVHLKCLADVFELAEKIPWTDGEGFVITDARCSARQHSWRRLKVKSMAYVRVHAATAHAYANDVIGFCLSTWLNSEESEVLAYFPQFAEPYAAVRDELGKEGGFLSQIVGHLNHLIHQHGADKKGFFLSLEGMKKQEGVHSAIVFVVQKAYMDLIQNKNEEMPRAPTLLTTSDMAAWVRSKKRRRLHEQHAVSATHEFWVHIKDYLKQVLPAAIAQMKIPGARGPLDDS